MQTSMSTPASWWIGLSRDVFMAEATRRAEAMSASREGLACEALRIADLRLPKKVGRPVVRTTLES
jgi:hypothetical protein